MSAEETFVFEKMTPELQKYLEHRETYSERTKNDEYKEWKAESEMLEKLIPEGLKDLYNRQHMAWKCRDATASKEPKVIKSDSERYELHLTYHSNGPGYWNYSKAKVFRDGTLVTEVCRNYGSFPFLFVEGHPNGNDYLICGEDYQGQVVIELNTGRRRGLLPEEAKQGHGFCWSSYEFDVKSQLLVVNGCFWACPYEYKLFDFSDPMEKGWAELTCEGHYIDSDYQPPSIDGDIIKSYDTKFVNEDDEDLDDTSKAPRSTKAVKTFRREGLKLIFVEEWVSEEEQKARKEREESEARYEAWKKEFKASDPLYLAYVERVKDPWLSPEEYMSTGFTHEKWCPDPEVKEGRWCRRIAGKRGGSKGITLDYEWAVKTGPVKLIIYKDGKHVEDKFWPHSVEGVNAAFDYAKELLVT